MELKLTTPKDTLSGTQEEVNHVQKAEVGSKIQRHGTFQQKSKICLNFVNCSSVNICTIVNVS